MKRLRSLPRFLFLQLALAAKLIFKFLKAIFRFVNRKKRYALPFYGLLAYAVFVYVLISLSGDPHYRTRLGNKRINDVTRINPIQVNKILKPHSVGEIVQAIQSTTGPISIGGGKFSMGGQTAFENSLHIDTREFNKIVFFDPAEKKITVQPGITWRDLQAFIDPYHLSVKIMQTYADFTVGGSVSVNCHGRYIGHGPIISSVTGLKLVTSNGTLITASRTENPEVFKAAVGGYGGIGVIVEVSLQLADNVKVERFTKLITTDSYNNFFNSQIKNDTAVVFQNGDLYPPHFDVINNVAWRKTDKVLTDTSRFTPSQEDYWMEQKFLELVSWGHFGKWLRKSVLDPLYYRPEKVTWRNKEASYHVNELEPVSREKQTYVLQEYFIPVNRIKAFIPKMKAVFDQHEVNVINVSLRHAYADQESFLSWAKEEVFAFVIYYKQGTDAAAKEQVRKWTLEMTEAILSEQGSWYLPYQPHATPAQFAKAYPQASKYFEVKTRLDPAGRFTNKLIDRYNPQLKTDITRLRETVPGYFRSEEQTILTVPEWYLVFNPKEYADFLEEGKNPSDFPFYASIDEYWKLYDRSKMLVSEAYPENEEYMTMLQVIGVSVTMEYAAKILYENTIGKLFGLFGDGTLSEKEKTIVQAQRAYSDFIYDQAWYEFAFTPWIGKVWAVSGSSGGSLLRQYERTLFFTMEFAFKAGYAQLIEWAAKASYEAPVTDIYLLVSSEAPIRKEGVNTIREQGPKRMVSIKRWGEFTKTLLSLEGQPLEILEIGGNDEIAVSILSHKGRELRFSGAQVLYDSEVVTDQQVKRSVVLLPVSQLLPFIRYARSNQVVVEHIYDY